jgi:antitoxin ParD1/3/4
MNMNVSLTDELVAFVKAKVGSGRYTSSSEVVREALRLMERQEEEKLAWLRQAYRDGIDSGNAGALNFDALKAEGRKRLSAQKT